MSEDQHRVGQRLDHCDEIVELSFEGVVLLVAAPTAPAPIDRDHGEGPCKRLF